MKSLSKHLFQTLLLSFITLWQIPAWSAENDDPDAQKPIEITADQLEFSKKSGKSIYTGHVIVTQGSMKLTGDKVIMLHPQQKIQKVEVYGRPAYFKKYLPTEKKWNQGHAQTIIYWATSKKIRLIGQAFFQQGNSNQISGPELIYDMNQQTLQAHATEQEKSRIHVTIQPETVEKQQP